MGKSHSFFYDAGWAKDESCQEVITSVWNRAYSNGTSWARLCTKLEECVTFIKKWHRSSSYNGQQEILKLNKWLLSLQAKEDTAVLPEIKKIQAQLHVLLDKKELWWQQRAKEDWLKMGDRNTRFFHACASEKQR
jgi:hypothetical protein